MENFLFGVILFVVGFVVGYYDSMTYWYERAENGSLIVIKGSVYKLEKQDIKE